MCAETSPPLAQNPLSWGATHHPAGRFSGNRASGPLLAPSPLASRSHQPGEKGPLPRPGHRRIHTLGGPRCHEGARLLHSARNPSQPRAPRLSLSIQNDLQEQRPRRSWSSSKGRSSQGSECVTAAEGESSPSPMGFPAFGAALFPPGLAHARPWWFEAWISPRGSGLAGLGSAPNLAVFIRWLAGHWRAQPTPCGGMHGFGLSDECNPNQFRGHIWGDLASGCGRRSWMVPSRSASRKDLNSGRAAIG